MLRHRTPSEMHHVEVPMSFHNHCLKQHRMVLVVIFFLFFEKQILLCCCNICDLVHHVDAIFQPPNLTASGNLFRNMSDARETAICNFTGIIHISEKISRCCQQLR